jgi:hypothetical protein
MTLPYQPYHVPPGLEPPSEMFAALPSKWQNVETKIVYIGIDGSHWNLSGNFAGREGLTLAPQMSGFMHVPFNSLFSEGPYQIGAVFERTDMRKRVISLGVQVNVDIGAATGWRYRMLEQKWWRAWSPTADGTLCCYTRTHGWRFLRVRLAEEPKTAFDLDPAAFGNNFMQWDMSIVALQPYWYKRMTKAVWKNDPSTATNWTTVFELLQDKINKFLGDVLEGFGGDLVPGKDVGSGIVKAYNGGDIETWPKFIVSSPGRAWIQDGIGGEMVALPLLSNLDGTMLVDTDPSARTLTCTTDPVDPLLYKIMRNSQLLDVILGQTLDSTLPIWRRFKGRFTTPIPPRTVANLKVYHSDSTGSVTMLIPQKFDKAYG